MIADLQRLRICELREMYERLTGQPNFTRNRMHLLRKVAWLRQARAEGGLTERARQRAAVLADDALVRTVPPRTPPVPAPPPVSVPFCGPPDPRMPAPGTDIVRRYKGKTVRVQVRSDGYEWDGQRYKSLTAVAEAVTGTHVSGYRFFWVGESRGAA